MKAMEAATAERMRIWVRARRPAIDALLIGLFCVVCAAFGFDGIWGVFSVLNVDVSPWWTLATALPGCLAVLTKRRFPIASLVAAAIVFIVDLLTIGGIGPIIILLDVLWTAAFLATPRGRTGLLIASAVAVVAMFFSALALSHASVPMAFLVALQFAAFVGTDYWWAVAVSQANELAELHRQRADEAAAVAERDQAEAVRRERETMARELHDVVAGHVMAMAIRAEAALSTTPDPRTDREALQAVRDAGLDAHGALRSMITVLRRGDGRLSPTPGWADLDGILAEARRAGLGIRFSPTDISGVGGATEQAVVRVVREALSNGIRHAAEADVNLDITASEEDVRVLVRSHGGTARTSVARGEHGWGLQMLRERVEALGGTFFAGPEEDSWTVRARLPLEVRA
jgi:signal transduction histidine kinase